MPDALPSLEEKNSKTRPRCTAGKGTPSLNMVSGAERVLELRCSWNKGRQLSWKKERAPLRGKDITRVWMQKIDRCKPRPSLPSAKRFLQCCMTEALFRSIPHLIYPWRSSWQSIFDRPFTQPVAERKLVSFKLKIINCQTHMSHVSGVCVVVVSLSPLSCDSL